MGARTRVGAVVVAATVAAALTGCIGPVRTPPDHRDEHGVGHRGPEPTARSYDDDVEVWDLTGTPDPEAFGIEPDDQLPVGAYSSGDPRSVRLVLPDGGTLVVRAREVIVDAYQVRDEDSDAPLSTAPATPLPRSERTRSATPRPTVGTPGTVWGYEMQVSGWITEDRDEAVRRHRALVDQLGLGRDSVDRLESAIDRIPDPLEVRNTRIADTLTTSGGVEVEVSTLFRPETRWRSYHSEVHVYWPPQEVGGPSAADRRTPAASG